MRVGDVQDAVHTGIGSLRARLRVVHTEFAAVNLVRRWQRVGLSRWPSAFNSCTHVPSGNARMASGIAAPYRARIDSANC